MNSHIKFVPSDIAIGLRHVDALRDFLGKEAEGLREILNLFAEFEASSAIGDLERLCSASEPAVMDIGTTLETVVFALEAIPFLALEQVALSGQGPRDLHAAVRWYGGRLTDLYDAFPG